jgi:predicted transglutaminase-like cysteine proteinase
VNKISRRFGVPTIVSVLILVPPAYASRTPPELTQTERFAAAFGFGRTPETALCGGWGGVGNDNRVEKRGASAEQGVAFLPDVSAQRGAGLPQDASAEQGAEVLLGYPAAPLAEPSAIPPRFLKSEGIQVLRTQYDERWRAAREARLSAECAAHVLGGYTKPETPEALLAFNRAVNGRVRYLDDASWGPSDDWAVAANTLSAGTGDCEDVAILKLQLLLALGVPEQDIYLTLVRDTVRLRDHAVVVMRTANGPVLLDSVSDTPLWADSDSGYRPVVAFSGDRAWLFGAERRAAIVR